MATPPLALATPAWRAKLAEPLRLDGAASFDAVDATPLFRWSLVDSGPMSEGHECHASHPNAAKNFVAQINDSTSRAPSFVAADLGTYCVDLAIGARRNFGDRELIVYDHKTLEIRVTRPEMRLFLRAETAQFFARHFGPGELAESPAVEFAWFPGGGQWGIGFTQRLFVFSLDALGTPGAGSIDLGGGSRLEALYLATDLPDLVSLGARRAELFVRAGAFLRLQAPGAVVGPTVGLAASWRLGEHFNFELASGFDAPLDTKTGKPFWIWYLSPALGYD